MLQEVKMKKLGKKGSYFSKGELALWFASVILIIASFVVFDRKNFLTLAASLVGVTSLVFNAKGNPTGHLLMIVFSVLYGIISWEKAYYGEMLTYLGMTAPMAVFALVSWIKNPYDGNKAEVKVNRLKGREYALMFFVSAAVTAGFYFVLKYFKTANLIPSTVSVTTSFVAVYLTARRSEFYALGYAANDVVLIILWALAAKTDLSCISVVACFSAFLFNDMYGYFNWRKMKLRQSSRENGKNKMSEKSPHFENE